MIGRAGQWTQTPSTTPLQPKKWNAHFCITFNIWCWPDWSMDLNLIHHPSPAKKNEMLLFWLCSTSDDWPGWLKDSNPIHHPSPAKKMKSSFLDYVQLLMISWAGWWTQTPSATPLQPKKWNAHFWILFNFWWSARLVNELKPHLPPLSSQKWNPHFWIMFTSDNLPGWLINLNPICHPSPTKKMKCSIFNYVQLLMISQADRWTQTPSATPLQPIKWNAHFCITFNFWWSAGLVDGLKPHLPPLSSQKHEMHIFVLHSTSDVGQTCQWTRTPSTTPLQPKKWNAPFLDYAQLLMIGWAEWWTQTSSTIPLQPKKWKAHFCIMFNF